MTYRNNVRPYSAGVTIKKPRLRRIELGADGLPTSPEGISNGFRPHGGYRGMKQHPPGLYSFNKEESYASEVQEEYQLLEKQEAQGAPYWVPDVQSEITHSGESPLFTNNLLAAGRYEQEHGTVNMERALFSAQPRRLMSAPRRRHLNGVKEFYRPNSTHQYLSATDLRNLGDSEEVIAKFGRPTRTTLLRARQRSNSAINSYDLRRQASKRMEEVKNNTIFYTAKEYFNIYQSDGQTMHSFLTGARYNRAHLLDSKGLSVYGVYMPRENPAECFITTQRRMKDVGDEIPSAPPDSPRSDIDDNSVHANSRPSSSSARQNVISRESSRNSSRPNSKTYQSRPPSNRKAIPQTLGSRPRSAKDPVSGSSPMSYQTRPHPPRSADSSRRDLPLPEEVTIAMPDHVNKGKAGVYVTLKGQKLVESVESKLPRVTGVSLPKLRNKSRDFMEEVQNVNQPPPTPVEPSVVSFERNRFANDTTDTSNRLAPKDEAVVTTDNKVGAAEQEAKDEESGKGNNNGKDPVDEPEVLGEVVVNENLIDERKTMEIRPAKHVNFSGVQEEEKDTNKVNNEEADAQDSNKAKEAVETMKNEAKVSEEQSVKDTNDNVAFFMTEENGPKGNNTEVENEAEKVTENAMDESAEKDMLEGEENDKNVDNGEIEDKSVDDVIKVEISEISESDKSKDVSNTDATEAPRITSNDFPFVQSSDK